MRKEFVTYEIAKELVELGFKCDYHFMEYDETGELQQNGLLESHELSFIPAPLWQQVIDWFRDEYYIFIVVDKEIVGSDEWDYSYTITFIPKKYYEVKRRAICFMEITSFREGTGSYTGAWGTYYEAKEQAILKAIEICKEKSN